MKASIQKYSVALSLILAACPVVAQNSSSNLKGHWEVDKYDRDGKLRAYGYDGHDPVVGGSLYTGQKSWADHMGGTAVYGLYGTGYGIYGYAWGQSRNQLTAAGYFQPFIRRGVRAEIKGALTPTIKWVPDPNPYGGTTALPPTVFYTKERGSAVAYGTANAVGLVSNNGLGVAGTVVILPQGGEYVFTQQSGASSSFVRRVKNPPATIGASPPATKKLLKRHLEASGYAASSTTDPYAAKVQAYVEYSVDPNAQFNISSPDTERSYKKLATGMDWTTVPPSTISTRWPHDTAYFGQLDDWPNRNICDRHHIDTVVERAHPTQIISGTKEDIPQFPEGFYGGGGFGVIQNVFDSPKYEWKLMGEGTPKGSAVGELAKNQPGISFQGYSDALESWSDVPQNRIYLGNDETSFPKESTIRVKATDSSNMVGDPSSGVANGFFYVKWHMPHEKTADIEDYYWRNVGPCVPNGRIHPANNGQPGGLLVDISVPPEPVDYVGVWHGLSLLLEAALPEEGAVVEGAAAMNAFQKASQAGKFGLAAIGAGMIGASVAPSLQFEGEAPPFNASAGSVLYQMNHQAIIDHLTISNKRDIRGLDSEAEKDQILNLPNAENYFDMEIRRCTYLKLTSWIYDLYNTNGYVDGDYVEGLESLADDGGNVPGGIDYEAFLVRNSQPLPTNPLIP